MSAVTARAVLLHSSWDTLLCETVTLTHSSCLQPGARGSSVQQRAVTNGPTAASPAGPQTSPLQKVSVSLLPPGLPGGVWRGSSGAGMEQTSPHICIYVPSLGCRETLAGMHSSVPTRCPWSRGPTRVDGGLFAIRRLLGRGELSTKGAHAGSDVPAATGRNIGDETLPSPTTPPGSRPSATTPARSPQPAAHTLRISQPARAEPMHSQRRAGAPSQLGTGERMTHPLLLLRWEPGGSPLVPASQLGTGSLESQSRHDPAVPRRAPGTT